MLGVQELHKCIRPSILLEWFVTMPTAGLHKRFFCPPISQKVSQTNDFNSSKVNSYLPSLCTCVTESPKIKLKVPEAVLFYTVSYNQEIASSQVSPVFVLRFT